MTCKTSAAALLLLVVPVAAQAQSPSTQPSSDRAELREKVKAACAADIQKFCAQIDQVKGARRACLQAHENELSAECRAQREARAAAKAGEKDKAKQ
jgi:flagellar motility protein MotE (MotC chaperone)